MSKSSVPHAAGAKAEVNAPVTETLYDPDGVAIAVPAEAVEKFLRLGYSREYQDIPAVLSELTALSGALAAPWAAYADACAAAGAIDNAAQDTARAALDELVVAANRLHLALHRRYPVQQEN